MATQTTAPAATRRAGFDNQDDEVGVDRLPRRGHIPRWLSGTLVRVTPAVLDVGGAPLRHWFDGLAMLNAFGVREGHVSYGRRFLDPEARRAERKGEMAFMGFAQDPCRSLFKRVMTVIGSAGSDNANVN